MGIDIEAEIDQLYQLPPTEFVEARNALAARVKARGDKGGATRVKALVRPNAPAWAANMVYWTARREFDELVTSVERLQKSQLQTGIEGAALRDAMRGRREALDLVLRRAAAILSAAGQAANPDIVRRMSNTLEALAADTAARIQRGRLVKDLEPPGFDAFAAMGEIGLPRPRPVPAVRPLPTPVGGERTAASSPEPQADRTEEPRAHAQEGLRATLMEAERRLDRARREAREAAGALSVAAKRAEAARAELDEAKRRFERAHERATLTAEDVAAATLKAGELAAARDAAEVDRETALRDLRGSE